MTFTDDDLKFWKSLGSDDETKDCLDIQPVTMKALIARLEAAELALEHFIDSTPVSDERTRLDDECDEWRKAAGK